MAFITPERLLRLYPGMWRLRYGSEFLALLEETGLTRSVVADTIRSAAWERLRWTRLGRMTLGFAIALPMTTFIGALNHFWKTPLASIYALPLSSWPAFWLQMLLLCSPAIAATWLLIVARPPAKQPLFGFTAQIAFLCMCVTISEWLFAAPLVLDGPGGTMFSLWWRSGAFMGAFLVWLFNLEGGAMHRSSASRRCTTTAERLRLDLLALPIDKTGDRQRLLDPSARAGPAPASSAILFVQGMRSLTMTLRALSAPTVVALALTFLSAPSNSVRQPAPAPRTEAQSPGTSTLDDQIDLALTVYNSDLALVRDVRQISLVQGTSDLHFMDIAATVNPATVHFQSLTEPARVGVLEQNYEYDLLEPAKLLHKYVGRDVTLVRMKDGREEEVRAHLISDNNGPVWQIGGEIVTGMSATHIRFPELPGNLYSRPTLIWTLDNTGGVRHRVEASYLAGQLAWNADYVLTVARDDKTADLDGWVTVRNGSGTSFRNATLQLVAGDLNRVRSAMNSIQFAEAKGAAAARPDMAQESFSDYHLYTLGRKTTINNAETKQVSMLNATSFPVQKRYVVDGQQFYYRNAQHPGSPLKDVVQVYYQLKNEERAGLGMPMPSGTVRVYQADSRGGLQFVGEDRIDHTPKDETINLKIGNAFDVICERKQTDYQRISSNTWEVEYEVTLRNHKAIPITVEVNEPVGGSWSMQRSSHQWTKTDAWAAKFNLPVAADGAVTLKYRVRVTY